VPTSAVADDDKREARISFDLSGFESKSAAAKDCSAFLPKSILDVLSDEPFEILFGPENKPARLAKIFEELPDEAEAPAEAPAAVPPLPTISGSIFANIGIKAAIAMIR